MGTGFHLIHDDDDSVDNDANDDNDGNDDNDSNDDNNDNDDNDENDIVNKNLPHPVWGLANWWTRPALSGRPSSGISCLKNG